MSLDSLIVLRRTLESGAQPSIEHGGFIDPRPSAASSTSGEKEFYNEGLAERAAPEEAGSSAGSRQRPRAETPASGTPARSIGAVGQSSDSKKHVSELSTFYPDARVVDSSPHALVTAMRVGLFRELPYQAELVLEIPLLTREHLTRPADWYRSVPPVFQRVLKPDVLWAPLHGHGMPSSVPDIRAWAFWRGPFSSGALIRSHHRYPDHSMCVAMPGTFVLGVHSILRYVDFCVLWIARALHQAVFGFFPGPQHVTDYMRVLRDRADECCGCGKTLQRYRDCCRALDRARPLGTLFGEHLAGQQEYLALLAGQGRAPKPPKPVSFKTTASASFFFY